MVPDPFSAAPRFFSPLIHSPDRRRMKDVHVEGVGPLSSADFDGNGIAGAFVLPTAQIFNSAFVRLLLGVTLLLAPVAVYLPCCCANDHSSMSAASHQSSCCQTRTQSSTSARSCCATRPGQSAASTPTRTCCMLQGQACECTLEADSLPDSSRLRRGVRLSRCGRIALGGPSNDIQVASVPAIATLTEQQAGELAPGCPLPSNRRQAMLSVWRN